MFQIQKAAKLCTIDHMVLELRRKDRAMEFAVRLRKAMEVRHVSEMFLGGSLEKPLHEALKLKPRFPWSPQDIRDARSWNTRLGELFAGRGTSPREISVLQSKILEFGQLIFSLVFVQYFLTMLTSLCLQW